MYSGVSDTSAWERTLNRKSTPGLTEQFSAIQDAHPLPLLQLYTLQLCGEAGSVTPAGSLPLRDCSLSSLLLHSVSHQQLRSNSNGNIKG